MNHQNKVLNAHKDSLKFISDVKNDKKTFSENVNKSMKIYYVHHVLAREQSHEPLIELTFGQNTSKT